MIILFSLVLIVLIVFLAVNQMGSRHKPKTHYSYYKNEYLKSLGWKRKGEANKKRDDLIRHFRSESERQAYYRNEYLNSEAWQRKRYLVLKRDNWRCVYCGGRATQVHHKKYAKRNIGSEPISWLVSICKPCHDAIHR